MRKLEVDKNEVIRLYITENLSVASVAKQLGVSSQWLTKYIKEEGIEKTTSSKRSKKTKKSKNKDGITSILDVYGKKPVEETQPSSVKRANRAVSKKQSETKVYTKKEKIAYLNKTVGVGRWRFLSKDDFMELVRKDLEDRKL